MPNPLSNRTERRLWGRAQGRPLSKYQSGLVADLLPRLGLAESPENPLAGLEPYPAINLEIGFGAAEHLLFRAASDAKSVYIGIEPFLNGVAKALAGIDKDGLENIRLHHGDARDIMDRLPDACLDNIYILFPDPWPKTRHFKRRLITDEFAGELYRILKPGGRLYFASDIPSYIDWALIRILRYKDNDNAGFHWPAERADDWMQPFEGWPGTRYEAKALREGRTPHYFTLIKPVKKSGI